MSPTSHFWTPERGVDGAGATAVMAGRERKRRGRAVCGVRRDGVVLQSVLAGV
jgi:hypothetical protein